MARFFIPHQISCGATISLDANQSQHLVKVLRVKKGDDITVFNGEGGEYISQLLTVNSKQSKILVKEFINKDIESRLNITLLQGISRHERMNLTIQKATELGMNKFVPVICKKSRYTINTERDEKRLQHWNQVAISASEQSGRTSIPKILKAENFETVIQNHISDVNIIMDLKSRKILSQINIVSNNITLLCGPESGFQDTEVQAAIESGFENIVLGNRILRTETAAFSCISAMHSLWGDYS